jgi:hypothetical protein
LVRVGSTSLLKSAYATLMVSVALDNDALRTPLVDLAELHLLDLIAPSAALEYSRHWPPSPFLLNAATA